MYESNSSSVATSMSGMPSAVRAPSAVVAPVPPRETGSGFGTDASEPS